jgi:hypothetical protein
MIEGYLSLQDKLKQQKLKNISITVNKLYCLKTRD